MPERPHPLTYGYVWICRTLMPSSSVRLLEQQLGDARHHLRTRDVGQFGHPSLDTDVELWAHPGDRDRFGSLVMGLLADQ